MSDEVAATPAEEVAPPDAGSDAPSGQPEAVSEVVAVSLDPDQWDALSGSLAVSNALLLAVLLALFAVLGSHLVAHFTQGWRR